MKYFSSLLARVIIFVMLLGFVITPTQALADTYGSGSYGEGLYGIGETNNGDSSGGGSTISSVGSSIVSFFCTNQAPSTAPNLYQIDVTNNTATLFFAPAGGPYDRHFIAYGQGNNSEGYGVEVGGSNKNGALSFDIKQLSPSTIYTFKVRGGNGCEPGPWSKTFTIKTLQKK